VSWKCLSLGACLWSLAACGDSDTVSTEGAGNTPVGYAVVCSDYVSSQVGLLQPDGLSVAAGALIHSGSRESGLVLGLSGDVVLPSAHASGERTLLLDRTHGVLTWVDRRTATVVRQLPVAEGFAGNPHDALERADGTVLVTRYASEPGAGTRGDDVVVFDEAGAQVQRVTFDVGAGVAARPDRIVPFGESVLVSLNHGAADYSQWESGRYVRLGQSGGVWSVEGDWALEGLRNCGGLAVDQGSAAVVCTGTFEGDVPVGEDSGAILTDSTGDEVARLLAADARVGGALGPAVAYREGAVWLVRLGATGVGGDTVLRWDPATDVVEKVLELERAFVIDAVAPMPNRGLLVPVGSPQDPRLCRLDETGWSCSSVCTESGLPPRSLLSLEEPG
jgi:hypothetical protein